MSQKGKEGKKSPKRNMRQLRDRKERKFYTDDILGDADDDIEGPQSFDLEEKLETKRFDVPLIKELKGTEFDLAYIQKHGFTTPVVFRDRTGLGILVPGTNFSVSDVKTCVGSKRMLDVMDVRTQKNVEMSMKEWQEYYDNPVRDRLLNVISLEFSHTKLANYVESPTVVRQLDWVDRVWPRHLKNMQTESTNVLDEMMYPKVQKYCLMSVKGCYTDFHVDFGGTSVWYHILKGAKVFWLIPPTEKNLENYQAWVLSGKQGDSFFGDNVEECGRVYLQQGDTFFIPSGWVHAVYTTKDSLVFGGNFLHSFGIDKQIRIATVEETTKVPQKFRYPFFTEMLWYTLNRYVHCLLGINFIQNPIETEEERKDFLQKGYYAGKKLVLEGVHLSPQELLGLKSIVLYLHQLPIPRKNVPAIIKDPVELLRAVRHIVSEHRFDNPDKAVTGLPILIWPGEKAEDVGKISQNYDTKKKPRNLALPESTADSMKAHLEVLESDIFLRRVRCSNCQSCHNTEDCKQCFKCVDRQGMCIMRECMKPLLPTSSTCCECGLDGWSEIPGPSAFPIKRVGPSNLLECSLCFKITHALCVAPTKAIGIVNDDLPNSWECPVCLEKDSRPRVLHKSLPAESRESTGNVHSMVATPLKPTTLPGNPSIEKISNNSGSGLLLKSAREDEKQVEAKLTQVQQRILQGRRSIDDPGFLGGRKANGKKPMSPPRKPAGKRPMSQLSSLEAMDDIRKDKISKGFGSGFLMEEDGRRREDDNKSGSDSLENSPKKGKEPRGSLPTSPVSREPKQAVKRRLSEDLKSCKVSKSRTLSSSVCDEPSGHNDKEDSDIDDDDQSVSDDGSPKKASPIKFPQRTQLSGQIMTKSEKSLKAATNVVRPAALTEDTKPVPQKGAHVGKSTILSWKDKDIMLQVFKRFDVSVLTKALVVCKDWNRIGLSPVLWQRLDLSHRKMTADIMRGITRRQPTTLVLDWSSISYQQLYWIMSRLPQLKELSLQGLPWKTVSALKSCVCPALHTLDLGYVGGLTDAGLREILAPPIDSRPGLTDSKSRLRSLKVLKLSGASISDVSLRYITLHAGSISSLDISTCSRITDAGIAQLGSPDSPSIQNLTSLSVSGCLQLTNISLEHLKKCRNLKFLDIRSTSQVQYSALCKYLSQLTPKTRVMVKSDYSAKYPGFGTPSSSGGPTGGMNTSSPGLFNNVNGPTPTGSNSLTPSNFQMYAMDKSYPTHKP